MTAARKRLPNRRPSHTETLEVASQIFTSTVGFDPASGQPCELFLNAGKEGSLINAMLADAAVIISIALQHGISAQALAKSIGRLPEAAVMPANLDQGPPAKLPASPIGAALDLISSFERRTKTSSSSNQSQRYYSQASSQNNEAYRAKRNVSKQP